MKSDQPIIRREFLHKLFKLSGCVILADAARLSIFETPDAIATAVNKRFIIEGIGQTDAFSVKGLVKKVFEAAGGMR